MNLRYIEKPTSSEDKYLRAGDIITLTNSPAAGRYMVSPPQSVYVFINYIDFKESDFSVEIRKLADEWINETQLMSNLSDVFSHPAYQKILTFGGRAVPFILRELERRPYHWFIALHAITNEDPVPVEARAKPAEMAEAWVSWGKQRQLC